MVKRLIEPTYHGLWPAIELGDGHAPSDEPVEEEECDSEEYEMSVIVCIRRTTNSKGGK